MNSEDMLNKLIGEAMRKAREVTVIVREDGSKYESPSGYAAADNGTVQVYVVPVTARTARRQEHFRTTFYVRSNNSWKRTTRIGALCALDKLG